MAEKHHCSLLLGRLQMLPPAIRYPSALLSVSTAQKIGEETEKGQQWNLALGNTFTLSPHPPLGLLV